MEQLYRFYSLARRHERTVLVSLGVLFVVSLLLLGRRFSLVHSELAPTKGGTYIEGSVGEYQPLNPWFTVQNDVNRDIVSLVFSGLLRYNPETKLIEPDLANMRVSPDSRIYTLTLKDGLLWHDSTPEHPHPVTPEDVLFTFKTIQDPDFPNPILRQNFEGVTVEKIDARTVRFHLEQSYSFFPSNLTIGIVPRRSFEGIPVSRLRETTDFGLQPVGAGPYAFKSFVQTERSSEVTLQRFPRPGDHEYFLERIILRIFPDYSTLLTDVRNLDGIRSVPRNDQGDPIIPQKFVLHRYTLPQYVAVFFNLDRPMLQDRNLRLGLQLGTNKQRIAEGVKERVIIDTPLLEIDTSDWRYQFDASSAQGALFESNWNMPEKVRLQRLLEHREASAVGPLHIAPVVLLDTGAVLTVTGSLSIAGTGALLNGAPLLRHPTETGSWIVSLHADNSTGSLAIGMNLVRLTKRGGDVIDSTYVWRTSNVTQYRKAVEEQRLVDQFLKSKSADAPADMHLGISDLTLDSGMLRRRIPTDARDIRVNDQGEQLSLRLLTSPSPSSYRDVAHDIADQWRDLGVLVSVDIPGSAEEFEQRMLKRDYDVLLFGQSLLDNLDSYPYWHSSGVQRMRGGTVNLRLDAYNLSQYTSQKSDQLLETIRETTNDSERMRALEDLRSTLSADVPSIFLYSPLYTFAVSPDVSGVSLGTLSLHSDRFLTLQKWFVRKERRLREGISWWSFIPWLLHGAR